MSIPLCTNVKPAMENFLATVLPRLTDTGGVRGSYPESFLFSPNFVVLRKNFFKHVMKTNISPP